MWQGSVGWLDGLLSWDARREREAETLDINSRDTVNVFAVVVVDFVAANTQTGNVD